MPRAALFAAVLLVAGCRNPTAPDEAAAQPDTGGVVEAVIAPKDAPAPPPADAPAASNSVPVSALTGRINLPAADGAWPWKLAAAAPKVEGKGATISLDPGLAFLAVSPESGRFVFAQIGGRPGGEYVTRYVLGDVAAGKVLAEWEVKDHMEPLDLSPDGTRVAAKNRWGDGKLVVFETSPDFRLTRRAVTAHDTFSVTGDANNPNDKKLQVAWAGFVGNDRLASAAPNGQVRVFNAATLTKVGTLEGPAGLTPTVTPDRKKLLAHAGGKVVLIDPSDCRVLGMKAFALPAGEKRLAVSPDGATLLCAKDSRLRFLSLTTGDVWDQVVPQFSNVAGLGSHFSWAGPKHVAAGDYLYDPAVSFAVWHVYRAEARAYTGRQAWAAARTGNPKKGERPAALVRTFDYAPADLAGVVEAGKARPDIYALAPWSRVRVDVSKLPAAKQAATKSDLEQRLREVGYVPAAAADTVLAASLDPSAERKTEYTNATNVTYTRTPLRLQLRHGGKVQWQEARAVQPPFGVLVSATQTVARIAAERGFGNPDYEWARSAAIPADVRGPAFPANGFGTTYLEPAGPRFHAAR
ncbi:MAG TPA: hypothetical protein VD866_01570 [Urbifossiella sp.]|nr:hypothetical protein [Urbifossiella sp.]